MPINNTACKDTESTNFLTTLIVLCCVVLCCVVLRCVVLRCVILYYIIFNILYLIIYIICNTAYKGTESTNFLTTTLIISVCVIISSYDKLCLTEIK